MIVNVQTEGTGCAEGESRLKPASSNNLVSSGVKKSDDVNESPDWGLIIGGQNIEFVLHFLPLGLKSIIQVLCILVKQLGIIGSLIIMCTFIPIKPC